MRRERARGVAHLLRLHREHDELGAARSRRRRTSREDADARKARRELSRAARRSGSTTRKSRGGAPAREHAADERGRHVAAADEGDRCRSVACSAGSESRASRRIDARRTARARVRPKIAVPTRTSVAPSAIAASRSADMPIDSVSTGKARRAARVEAARAARETARAPRRDVGGRRGDAHEAAQRAGAAAPRRAVRAPAPPRAARRSSVASPLDVHLHADVERRQRRRAAPRTAARAIFSRSTVSHPGEALGRGLGLVALQRPDQVPFDVRQGRRARPSSPPLPARSSRRMRAGRARRRARIAAGGKVLLTASSRTVSAGSRPRPRGRAGDARPHGLPRLLVVDHNRMTPA